MRQHKLKIYSLVISSLFIFSFSSVAADLESVDVKGALEGPLEKINTSSIEEIIKNDRLQEIVDAKNKEIEKQREEDLLKQKAECNYPNYDHFWDFMAEYWLVKNAQLLSWDLRYPDYGLEEAFRVLLERLGYLGVHFKIILISSTTIPHLGLPSDGKDFYFVLSQPFIRTMGLNKLEISLLLLEDFIRVKKAYFYKNIINDDITKMLGQNFYGQEPKMDIIEKTLGNYNQLIMEKGFSFDEQFTVTEQMRLLVKNDNKLLESYTILLKKIDALVKMDKQYVRYNQLYPSPEMQLVWMAADKQVI